MVKQTEDTTAAAVVAQQTGVTTKSVFTYLGAGVALSVVFFGLIFGVLGSQFDNLGAQAQNGYSHSTEFNNSQEVANHSIPRVGFEQTGDRIGPAPVGQLHGAPNAPGGPGGGPSAPAPANATSGAFYVNSAKLDLKEGAEASRDISYSVVDDTLYPTSTEPEFAVPTVTAVELPTNPIADSPTSRGP